MDLILQRHVEAEDVAASLHIQCNTDPQRELIKRDHRQTEKMANRLRPHLPTDTLVLAGPAVRTQQTARAFTGHFQTLPALAPGIDVSIILGALDWLSNTNLLLVGHQPWLGHLASLLIVSTGMDWNMKKIGM